MAFYSVPAIARMVGLTRESVRREILRGHLDAKKYGTKYLVTAESVHQWINDGTEAAREATLYRRLLNDAYIAPPRVRGGCNRGSAAIYAFLGEGATRPKK